MARVIIAAAGHQGKWGNYLGVPSHLAPVHGQPLLTRTINQALSISDDVHVTYPSGDNRYIQAAPRNPSVTMHPQSVDLPSEYHSTRQLWSEEGRTILLLGDTYFTDAAINIINRFRKRKYQGFGRFGRSWMTKCKYGELWAASWYPEQHQRQDEYLENIRQLRESGKITRPTGWMLLRSWQQTDLARHKCLPEWMTTINDLTEDWDFPRDYQSHPVVNMEAKKMEAGKGHAARNNKLPALLERLGVKPRHVVHVGAHDGEEVPFYEMAKFSKITLIEPLPSKAQSLKMKWPHANVIEAAAGEKSSASVPFHVMPVTNMSTLVTGSDLPSTTIPVKMIRLKDVAKSANVAVIDVQGSELSVLKGADLSRYDIVMVETSTVIDPTMAATYQEVTDYMSQHDFEVVEYWVRDYQWVAKWGRGRSHATPGEVRDVIYRRIPQQHPTTDTEESDQEPQAEEDHVDF